MRQTIGGSWVFMLVMVFTLLFAAYIALTINYSKSFNVKNEVLGIIEKSEGMTDEGIGLINNYLNQAGYKTTGKCALDTSDNAIGTFGVKTLDIETPRIERISNDNGNQEYYYCFTKFANYHNYFKKRGYYKISLFFRFDIPVLGRIGVFNVDGQTSEIDATYDGDYLDGIN